MADKTKAAMPGRQCNNALLKHRQITRLAAGGQTLSRLNPHAQTKLGHMPSSNNCVRLTYGHRDKHEQHSCSVKNNVKRGSEVPANNVESCEDNQPSLRGSVHSITGSNLVQLSDSDLAFLRCRRLISPMAAVIRKPAVLSPLFFTDSISSNTSCGTRTFTCFDLLFTEPVAITDSPRVWCYSLYAKKNQIQYLTCYAPSNKVNSTLIKPRHKNGNAPECGNTSEASNHNVIGANNMACIQHTQTRPKYQYRFLALSSIGRNVIHITATTEREAREQSPAGCVIVFAGRLPVREVRHA